MIDTGHKKKNVREGVMSSVISFVVYT